MGCYRRWFQERDKGELEARPFRDEAGSSPGVSGRPPQPGPGRAARRRAGSAWEQRGQIGEDIWGDSCLNDVASQSEGAGQARRGRGLEDRAARPRPEVPEGDEAALEAPGQERILCWRVYKEQLREWGRYSGFFSPSNPEG